jgi:hypothetical protein
MTPILKNAGDYFVQSTTTTTIIYDIWRRQLWCFCEACGYFSTGPDTGPSNAHGVHPRIAGLQSIGRLDQDEIIQSRGVGLVLLHDRLPHD